MNRDNSPLRARIARESGLSYYPQPSLVNGMGGFIAILVSVASAILLYDTGRPLLCVVASVNAALVFWTVGIMYNYAKGYRQDRAAVLRENLEIEGSLDAEAEARLQEYAAGYEPRAIPNALTFANLLLSFAGIGFLITAIVLRFHGP